MAAGMPAPNVGTQRLSACTASFRPLGGFLPGRRRSAHALLELALDLAARVALLDVAAAVAALLAGGEGDLDLGARALEVDPGGDQCEAALGGLADQALDLAAVQQQFAGAVGVVVLAAGRQIGRDVGATQPDLAVVDGREGLVELGLALAEGLDLAP